MGKTRLVKGIARNVRLTPEAWETVDRIAQEEGIGTRSGVIEQAIRRWARIRAREADKQQSEGEKK